MHSFTTFVLGLSGSLAYLAFFIIVFAESGLLIGFFLPGDSLLFSLGLIASQGHLNIVALIVLGVIAALTGDTVGYIFGKRVGPRFFSETGKKRWLNQEHLVKAQEFYAKHGVKTILLARFTPFARTFVPILAGVGEMNYSLFMTYNVMGGTAWVISILLLGYFIGNSVPNVDSFILPIIAGIILVTATPAVISVVMGNRKKKK